MSILITFAAFVVVVAGLRAAEPIVVPFLLSIFLAIICAPPLFWLERRGLPKWLAMLAVISAIVVVALGITALLGNSINDFSRDIPFYKTRLKEQFGGLVTWLSSHGVQVTREQVLSYVNPGKAIELVGEIFNGFGGVLANAFLIFLTVVFILFEAHSFPSKIRAAIDDPEKKLKRFEQFTDNLIRYLAIKTLSSLGTGVAIGVWLAIMGVQYPVLWGLLAFLLNYVPNIGSIIAAVPALLLTVVQLGPISALWTGLGYLVVNILVGSVIEPRFMGRGLGLSTLVVFLSLVFWGWLLGPVGMLLSVPLTMTMKIALDSSEETRWLAVMLGPESSAQMERKKGRS
ncbi:MAG: AI-2E family transporter [Gammaproteobacteria bacterium]|nr:AI-2E family transporter [Gammaproteobacteria bacterium]